MLNIPVVAKNAGKVAVAMTATYVVGALLSVAIGLAGLGLRRSQTGR